MRRRPKVVLLEDGKPWDGKIPDWAVSFREDAWPGYEAWERWDAWWDASAAWAEKHMPEGFDALMQLMTEPPSRPWNPSDI
ncbi:hypothetical protein GCM10009636_08490 [Arthrobacter koreensis]